ncbi:MAG: hypothetical protein J6I49_05980 [Bacteroidales bacterium]|nr:hypothetical protein [Bacteroidales bacterium]
MDKKEFVDKVSKPTGFTSQDRGWLKAKSSMYPYSSVVSTLALLADHAYGYDTPASRRAVALALCNPDTMDALLASASKKEAAPSADAGVDILNEINTFQEISFKTAPKSVILSQFLQSDPSEEPLPAHDDRSAHEFNDKKSLAPDVSLGTETLAVILEKQGKIDKALAIYKNLLAHNPEKSSIFAPRIERLETLLNSK